MIVELVSYFGMMLLVLAVSSFNRSINFIRYNEIVQVYVIFVIQPLFFLNGDVNFRKKVLEHGMFSALKQELFFIKVIWIRTCLV